MEVQHGQVVEEDCRVGVIWTDLVLAEFESLPPDRYSLLVLASLIKGLPLLKCLQECFGLGMEAPGPQPQDGQDE